MTPSRFVYRCGCGHSLDIETDAPDTPANRLKALADQGWGLDGLSTLCPCCIRHLQGEHSADAPRTYASDADVQRAAIVEAHRTYLRLTGDVKGLVSVEREWRELQPRIDAERQRRQKLEKCRRCHPDPNDTLLRIGTA